jgi:hypothetical protein
MNKLFLEKNSAKQVSAPVDLNAAAITGARISMKECKHLAIVLSFGASTGATVEATLKQHTAASGGTTANLLVKANYYHKVGAATSFTKVEARPDASLPALLDLTTLLAADGGIVVIEVLDEHLDTNNGYDYVSVDLADSGAAKIFSGLMIPQDCSHQPAYDLVF